DVWAVPIPFPSDCPQSDPNVKPPTPVPTNLGADPSQSQDPEAGAASRAVEASTSSASPVASLPPGESSAPEATPAP
ncbi:MAG: hypothetical protein ACXWW6_07005, partial [Candidatus Limnocylindrales bacterium]